MNERHSAKFCGVLYEALGYVPVSYVKLKTVIILLIIYMVFPPRGRGGGGGGGGEGFNW